MQLDQLNALRAGLSTDDSAQETRQLRIIGICAELRLCRPLHKRKNALFAGHEVGAENWAMLASIVATCKLSDVNPVAYIAATLEAILNGHPQSRIEDLMPWRFRKTSSPDA